MAIPNVKFKAKCLKTGKWIAGGYAEKAIQADSMVAEVAIVPSGCYAVAVDPKTLCMLVHVKPDGTEIYTSDIVTIKSKHGHYKSTVRFSFDSGIYLSTNKSVYYDYALIKSEIVVVSGNVFNGDQNEK